MSEYYSIKELRLPAVGLEPTRGCPHQILSLIQALGAFSLFCLNFPNCIQKKEISQCLRKHSPFPH